MNSNNIVIFIGPPGAGKGSLSNLCTENLNWVQLSTGNLCRKHIAEQTDIGRMMDDAIRAGKLIDDQLISSMVGSWLSEQGSHNCSVILDGYPRTMNQAESLMRLIQDKLPQFAIHVVKLSISDDKIATRLGARSICQNKNCQAVYSLLTHSGLQPKRDMVCDKCAHPLIRRADDEFDAIRERLKTYYKHEKDLLDYYQSSGIGIKNVDVEKSLIEVFQDFKMLLGLQ